MGTQLARRFAAGCMAHGSACDPWRFISKGRCGIKHVTRTIRLACARQSKMPHASCAYWWQGPATSQKKSSQNGQQHDPILRYIFWPVFWAPLHNLVGGGSPETKSVPKTGVVFRTQFSGFGRHFLHHLATQCAPQHAPWPPEAGSNLQKVGAVARHKNQQQTRSHKGRGRPSSAIERLSSSANA